MTGEDRVIIGKVLTAHGVKGELKTAPLTDYPERYLEMRALSLYRKGEPVGEFGIKNVRAAGDSLLITLEGIDDMDAANALRGCTIEIPKSERAELPEGEFWISDLIGLTAERDTGQRLGTVKDIVESGASQLIIIAGTDGKEHMVPANEEFLLGADLTAKTVTLRLIDGLWEL